MTSIRLPLLLLVLAFTLPPVGLASSTEMTAEQIVARSAQGRAMKDSLQTMTMTTFSKTGSSSARKLTSRIRGAEDGRVWSYVRFVEPEDLAGVEFLSIDDPQGEDEQFLYMPAGGNFNRISGSSKKGAFMGSDLTYEDLSVGSSVSEATHTIESQETIVVAGATLQTWKIKSVPKPDLDSAYSAIVTWIDRSNYAPRQVEFIDTRGELVKRMRIEQVRSEGDVVVPMRTVMENLKRGSRTEIQVEVLRLGVPASELPETILTPEFIAAQQPPKG